MSMPESGLAVALYAMADEPRKPELTLGRLRTAAESRGWNVVAEFWDTRTAGLPRLDLPAGWASARSAAEARPDGTRAADVLLVAQLIDVADTPAASVALDAWAADHQVPVVFMDAGLLGCWFVMGPAPDRLAELRHPLPVAATACRGLPGPAAST